MRSRTRTGLLVTILPAVAALLLSACGSDETTTVTEMVTVTETSTVASEPPSEPPGPGTDGAPPAAEITVGELTGFSSPTGNIGCFIEPLEVRCDISERDWEPPERPADCTLDYGQGLILRAGTAPQFVCAGDTALGAGDPLPYGSSIAAGLLFCESKRSGMRCRDTETGRGFSLNRENFNLF